MGGRLYLYVKYHWRKWVVSGPPRALPNPYLVTWDQEFADKVPEIKGYNRPTLTVPAGTVGPNQTQPVNTPAVADYFACYDDINSKVPYEIAKMQAEYATLITEQNMFAATTPFIQKHLAKEPFTRDLFHKGALKYFDEAGVAVPQ